MFLINIFYNKTETVNAHITSFNNFVYTVCLHLAEGHISV